MIIPGDHMFGTEDQVLEITSLDHSAARLF